MGLYQRSDSRFWWMSYKMNGEQHQESTKTASKELAIKSSCSGRARSCWVCSRSAGRASE